MEILLRYAAVTSRQSVNRDSKDQDRAGNHELVGGAGTGQVESVAQ